ncbi:MAG: carbonic anhydrase [Desulfotalea sp.]
MVEEKLPRPTADEVMASLIEGNSRFRSCSLEHPNLCQESRDNLVNNQEPIATILTCADSRVPPVNIFDQGLGDLFVVRVAGNIVNDHIMGSIEYAASHLHTPLVIVMGHSNCGAVDAVAKGVSLGGHMASLGPAIQEAIKNVQDAEGNLTNNAAKELAKLMAQRIRTSEPIMADLVKNEKVKVVSAYYDLESGIVDFFE